MTAQHEKYEERLKASAEQAFEEMPDEYRDEAAASRTQLLNWLVNMDRATKNPAELVDDNVANVACNVFEAALAHLKQSTKEKAALNELEKAFNNLSDDTQLNLLRFVVGQTLASYATNCALVTRANDLFLWENVGFHIDGDIKCAFAKVGRQSYQAIGFDDGEHYIGTEGSKTLWLREFGMAVILPYAPPFHVERAELEEQVSSSIALSDKEREKIEEVVTMFEADLSEHGKLTNNGKDKETREELEDKMREGIKLARIRLPRFDQKMDEFLEENPEAGENFENVDIVQLLVSCSEFLRMKLDDDEVRRDVEATVISTDSFPTGQRKLITTLMGGISSLIPKEGDEPDHETLMQRINEVAISMPTVRELLADVDPSSNTLDAAEAVLIWLQKELDKLPEESDE